MQLGAEQLDMGRFLLLLVAAAPLDLEGMVPYTTTARMGCLGHVWYTEYSGWFLDSNLVKSRLSKCPGYLALSLMHLLDSTVHRMMMFHNAESCFHNIFSCILENIERFIIF